jgi:hypothetical protein
MGFAMPMVAVVAPDGSKEYWIAALEYKDAVAAVKKCIPADYRAELSILRLPVSPRWSDCAPVKFVRFSHDPGLWQTY